MDSETLWIPVGVAGNGDATTVAHFLSDLHHEGERRLREFIHRAGIVTEILTPDLPMPTVPLAASAINVHVDQIIKSVLFMELAGQVALAIACGTSRIDRARLSAITGLEKLRLADPETVLIATGFPAGGVAPVGHATQFPIVIDSRVMEQPIVFGGAGSERSLLRISPADIQRLTGAQIADITLADKT